MSNALKKSSSSSIYDEFFGQSSSVPTMYDCEILPKEREALLRALNYLESIGDGWNGYGGRAPSTLAIAMARHFVTLLPFNKCHANKIAPDGDGGITLTWGLSRERIILTIDGSMMHLSHEKVGAETVFVHNEPFFDLSDTILPKAILIHIPNQER